MLKRIIVYSFLLSTSFLFFYLVSNDYVGNNTTYNDSKAVLGETSNPTPTSSNTPYQQTQTPTKEVQVECWGPDGKSFMTTKSECVAFNTKWGNDYNTTTSPTSQPQDAQSSLGLTYYCHDNVDDFWYYTSSMEQCNEDNDQSLVRSLCESNLRTSVFDPCYEQCSTTYYYEADVCSWAYSGSDAAMEDSAEKYDECFDEVYSNLETCSSVCSDRYVNEYSNQCVK